MDNAYIFMLGTFAFAMVCGFFIPSRAIAVLIPTSVPILSVVFKFVSSSRARAGETLLFVSPFLIAIALGYGVISLAGVSIGRRFRGSRPQDAEQRPSRL